MSHISPKINPTLDGMSCLKCHKLHPIADYFEGCPDCLKAGRPSSVAPHYSRFPHTLTHSNIGDWLVYTGKSTLGEGNTPLVNMPRLAEQLNIGQLSFKNEGANPTGSHKDRMSALATQRALDIGAKTMTAASSGNAGASLAAYAAFAGLNSVILTTPKMSANWRRACQMHGAKLLATQNVEERWEVIAKCVKNDGHYPVTNYLTPPVGSNPFGVDAYRAVAFEIWLQTEGELPTDIIVPTTRGDLLWGIAQGFCDLKQAGIITQIPKVHLIEPFARVAKVLNGADYRATFEGSSKLTSLGGTSVAYQALDALEKTNGKAIPVEEAKVIEDQNRLAACGFYVELSSACALTGLKILINQGDIGSTSNVILLTTSHGYKEFAEFDAPIELITLS